MPTYEYECESCGKTFELFQSITERPVKKCPACGRRKAQRRIGSGGAVIFKGSGFYKTDYRSEEYKRRTREESGTSGSTPAKEKTDKPARGGQAAPEADKPA
jgi:putative FmdB family regulatory protein